MAERTYRITVSGKMLLFFEGSGPGQGLSDERSGYVGGEALYVAIQATPMRSVGPGGLRRYMVLDLSRDALDVLAEYAEVCLVANSDEPDQGEVRAARKVLARYEALIKTDKEK